MTFSQFSPSKQPSIEPTADNDRRFCPAHPRTARMNFQSGQPGALLEHQIEHQLPHGFTLQLIADLARSSNGLAMLTASTFPHDFGRRIPELKGSDMKPAGKFNRCRSANPAKISLLTQFTQMS
jgi:hypothetical protein